MTNKYLVKSSSLLGAALIYAAKGGGAHVVQNAITKFSLGNKYVAKSIADRFASGVKGVHNTSLASRVLRTVGGAVSPEIEEMHHEAWEVGRAVGRAGGLGLSPGKVPSGETLTRRQLTGLRMLSQGKFSKVQRLTKQIGFTPESTKLVNDRGEEVLEAIRKRRDLPHTLGTIKKVMDTVTNLSPETAKRLDSVAKSRDNPLLSNILGKINKGEVPKKVAQGPSSKLLGLAGSFVPPTTHLDILGHMKRFIPGVKPTVKKVAAKTHPVLVGSQNPGKNYLTGLRNRLQQYLVSPVSQSLKHTSSQVTEALGPN